MIYSLYLLISITFNNSLTQDSATANKWFNGGMYNVYYYYQLMQNSESPYLFIYNTRWKLAFKFILNLANLFTYFCKQQQ